MAYLVIADVKARVSAADYERAFDRDATGSPSLMDANCQTAINAAISRCNMILGESFGPTVQLDLNGAIVDEAVKSELVALTLWEGIRYSPLASGTPTSAYRQAMIDAVGYFEKLRKDDGARLQTANGGRAKPRATLDNLIQDDGGTFNQTFSRSADGKDRTMF